MTKIKTYVVMISKNFPAIHPKKGQPTNFMGRIKNTFADESGISIEINESGGNVSAVFQTKIHTIRSNYELWSKRIAEVSAGNAILSLRQWTGSPYNFKRDGSKPVEFLRLTAEDGVGIQLLKFCEGSAYIFENGRAETHVFIEKLSLGDGLSVEDFKAWFKNYELDKPMAILHFTKFRY